MWIKIAGLAIVVILLVGCTNNNDEAFREDLDDFPEPTKYDADNPKNDPFGVGKEGEYPQSDQTEMNDGDESGQSDLFTNEESVAIANHLTKKKEVIQSQVALTDNKVVVGVMLNESAPADMRERIKKEVQEMKPNKKVNVYTDDIYWDRMRNKDSKLDHFNGDMEEFLNEFFNTTRE
ncbi:YhcN/YlaJ family sporulation lipoprotein [Virgibacillus doumboii]|uniref:YhcN/YlaJ family sporulation lipoprotein n=1 Tax=Virgibacillus doumboii TaxID=2697503 RepID=UPI0013E0E503|nr:YhcN/YlaJ family sporulation lipoprotein [Virgibacillus doumboii]